MDLYKALELLEIEPEEHFKKSIIKGALFSVVATFVIFLWQESLDSIYLLIVLFPVFYFYFKNAPLLKIAAIEKELENKLPLVIFDTLPKIYLKENPEKIISSLKCKKYGHFSKIAQKIEALQNHGLTMKEAILTTISPYRSLYLKRFFNSLLNVFEYNYDPSPFNELQKEMVSMRKNKIKEFGNKSTLFSLIFIAIVVLLPAFYLGYSLFSFGFGKSFDYFSFRVILLFLFPLIDLVFIGILYIMQKTFL